VDLRTVRLEAIFSRKTLPETSGLKYTSKARRPFLMVKFRQPSHEFTFGVGMNFISYPLVLTPLV
jgi:hypothetical protein